MFVMIDFWVILVLGLCSPFAVKREGFLIISM